jgi:hypothetical protein
VGQTERRKSKNEFHVIIETHSISVPVTILLGQSSKTTFQVPSAHLASESIALKEMETIATVFEKSKQILERAVACAHRSGQAYAVTDRPGSRSWLSSIMPPRRCVTSPEWVWREAGPPSLSGKTDHLFYVPRSDRRCAVILRKYSLLIRSKFFCVCFKGKTAFDSVLNYCKHGRTATECRVMCSERSVYSVMASEKNAWRSVS